MKNEHILFRTITVLYNTCQYPSHDIVQDLYNTCASPCEGRVRSVHTLSVYSSKNPYVSLL